MLRDPVYRAYILHSAPPDASPLFRAGHCPCHAAPEVGFAGQGSEGELPDEFEALQFVVHRLGVVVRIPAFAQVTDESAK